MATEKRLIDAKACPCTKCERIGNCRPGLCEAFAEWWLSSVDAVEVVHGRWIHDSVGFDDFWTCSACGEDWFFIDDPEAEYTKVNYCPNCGAKMDGDGNG